MTTTVVRYVTKPEAADENEALVRAVYAELAEANPETIRYATFRLDDGVTFIHIADIDGENPLLANAAFQAFSSTVGERCVEGPKPMAASIIGSHRFPLG